jgi:osmotically-inducible protein OsmY
MMIVFTMKENGMIQRAMRVAVSMAVVGLIATAGCAARQQVVQRDDGAITQDVQARLNADPASSGSTIGVETKAGIVSLSGAVKTETTRTSAERIARDTPGVRSVDNNVRFGD